MILFKIIHKNHVSGWADYKKTGSYKNGARWNSSGTPVLYFSSNIQNPMLEIANYSVSPKMANKLFRMVVFEVGALRLHPVPFESLPPGWNNANHPTSTKLLGDTLLNNPDYDGFIVPSAGINNDIISHPLNDVRQSAYCNVVVNPEKLTLSKHALIDGYTPIFSEQMFSI